MAELKIARIITPMALTNAAADCPAHHGIRFHIIYPPIIPSAAGPAFIGVPGLLVDGHLLGC